MKNKWFLMFAASIVLLAMGFMLANITRAQVGIPGDDDNPSESVVQSEEPAVEIGPLEEADPKLPHGEDLQPLAPGAVTVVDDVVQIQGRLTDSSGNPLNGNQNVTVTIYDSPTAGTARCSDSDTVAVADGLFTMAMDFCTAQDFNGDALFMGIKVGADPEMTPRQQIYSVPYAWALRPGAIVKGADSFVFISGSELVKNLNTDTTRWDIQSNGAARIRRGAVAGSKIVYFPITVPAELYGQDVTLVQMTVYYKVSNATNGYIDRTVLNVQTDADSWVNIIDDATNHTSTVASSYSFTLTTNNVISSLRGSPVAFLSLFFANDTDYVDISAIRLRLRHY